IFMQNHLLIWNKSKLDISNSNLKGPHNIANIMAAILATSEFKINNLEQTINNFQPLAHRMEVVDKINGITFINDSKATNTESVKYALQSFSKPVNIIMGGQGKNEDYSVLNKLLKQHAKKIYLIGSSTEDMENAFQNIVATQRCKDLKEAVIKAYQQSKKEDIILLSPACTSYDMFQNFEVRGNIFKKIVRDIKNDE
ncbi:MAG: cyanophycin synthetase, partial [Thermotogota bacterium]|nr:cyanophycin synthetase [Thermotogota bacterium]